MVEITFKNKSLIDKLPKEVKTIFTIFGKDIRLVGGSVRNLLIDKKVEDFDFATKLKPDEIKEILATKYIKFVDLAEKFGTIIAVINHKNFEITTLRKDFAYDGRHCQVIFSDNFQDDALRRDFTINALYLDDKGNIYDYCNGIEDLKNKKVKFIGNPELRIKEDYLRILRFIRFSCQYSNEIDEKGLKSCIEQKENLNKLSKSRIRQEFLKILNFTDQKKTIGALQILENKGFSSIIFNKNININNLQKSQNLFDQLNQKINLNLKIALLFIDSSFKIDELSKNLCLTRIEKKYLSCLFKYLQYPIEEKSDLINLALKIDFDILIDLYFFRIIYDCNPLDLTKIKENLDFLNKSMVAIFPLNGNDLLKLGFNSTKVGQILQKCKEMWLFSDCKLNKKDLLLEISKI